VGYVAGSLLAGHLYDRRPGHPMMVAAIAGLALLLALTPLVPGLWALTVVMTLLGAAEAITDVGANTLIVWQHGSQVGPLMNGLHFAFGLGAFLSPLIVAQAMAWGGSLAWAYGSLAVLALPGTLWLARLPSPAPRAAPAQTTTGTARPWLLALIIAAFFLYTGSEVAFGAWVYSYATVLNLADPAQAAYLNAAFWGALTLGRLAAVPLSQRVELRVLLAADVVGCLLSVGVMILWPTSPLALWVGGVGLGLAMASIFPNLLAFAEQRLHLTGRITSWFFLGASGGATVLPWLIGQVFEPVGPRSALHVVGAGVALLAVIFWLLLRRRH
jgi:FHS family Na+ dependent glucose MFS transporter 1